MIQRWKGHNSHIKHPILAESAEFVCRKHTWAGRQNHPPPIFWGVGWGAEFICHFWTGIGGQNRSSSRGCIKWGGGRLQELLFWPPIRGQKWYTTPPPHPHLCTFPKISAALCIIHMILSSTPPLHLDNCWSVFDCNMKPMPRAAIRPRIFDRNSTHTHRDTAHPPCTYST